MHTPARERLRCDRGLAGSQKCVQAISSAGDCRSTTWNSRAKTDGSPTGRGLAMRLFLVSFAALFLELMVIRWVPSMVRFVAYYANLMLISSFLGLGIGAMLSRRGWNGVGRYRRVGGKGRGDLAAVSCNAGKRQDPVLRCQLSGSQKSAAGVEFGNRIVVAIGN